MGLDNPIHLAFLVVILLLLFGAKRLPEIGRSLGTGMREFKDSISGGSSHPDHQQQTLSQATQVAPQPVQAPQPVAVQPAPAAAQPVAAQPAPVELPQQPAPAPAPENVPQG
jgi:sec-independent protein translocase protein TatA